MNRAVKEFLFKRDNLNPKRLGNLAAWFDAQDVSTILGSTGAQITDGAAVALWGDKSGNSGTLAFVSDGAASNTATTDTKSITGNQTMTFDIALTNWTPKTNHTLFSKLSGNSGLEVLIITTGVIRVRVGDGEAITNFDSTTANTCTDLTRHMLVITYTDNSSVTFAIDGVALGTSVVVNKTLANGDTTATIGTSFAGRIYRAKIGTVYDFNPSTTTKLSTRITDGGTGAGTWTINTSGATGARISGERDLYQGTVANRLVWLQYSGLKYGYLYATTGVDFSTPNSVAFDALRTDFTCTWYGSADDWTPSSVKSIWSQSDGSTNKCVNLQLNTNGRLYLEYSTNGSASIFSNSTAATGFTDGTYGYIRVTRQSSTGNIKFYTSTDGITFNQLGTTVAGTSGTLFDSTNIIYIGQNVGSLGGWNGRVGSVVWNNGYDNAGSDFATFNPNIYTSGNTFTASTGEVWSINGGAHIVTRSCNYGDGSNDSLKSAAYSCAQPTTIYWVGTMESWTASDYLFDGNTTNGGALVQTTSTPQVNLNAGSSVAGNTGAALKTWGVFCAVLNGASSTLRWMRLAATTGDAGAGNMNGLTLLARGAADAGWFNGVVGEVAQYSGAHDLATQNRWALYAGRKWWFTV